MTRYYVVCVARGERERLDWTYDADEAAAWVKEYEKEDDEARRRGAPVTVCEYVVEEVPEEDDEDGELECGDYPDDRSVVCAGGRVRRFASGYTREMWEIGMRESDFC